MGDVVDLAEYREAQQPHVVIRCDDGTTRVYPVRYFELIAQGASGLAPIDPPLLRAIVAGWVGGLS